MESLIFNATVCCTKKKFPPLVPIVLCKNAFVANEQLRKGVQKATEGLLKTSKSGLRREEYFIIIINSP